MSAQDGWRFCGKGNMMFFDGFSDKGCFIGGAGHRADGFNFFLPFDVPPDNKAQSSWRLCAKCSSMFFDGRPDKGACVGGGGHQAEGFNFCLPHDLGEHVELHSGSITSGLSIGDTFPAKDPFHDKMPGLKVNFKSDGTSRNARASGSISYLGTNLIPVPAYDATLEWVKTGEFDIIH